MNKKTFILFRSIALVMFAQTHFKPMKTRRQTFIDNLDVGILEWVIQLDIHRVYALAKNFNVGI